MAFLDITAGNANAAILAFEDHFKVKSTELRKAGTLAALMSPQNRQGEFALIQRDMIEGHRREFLLRFKKNGFCGEAVLDSATSKGLSVCDGDNVVDFPGSWTTKSIEYAAANFTGHGRKWTFDLDLVNNEWGVRMIEAEARRMREAMNDIIVRQLNPGVFLALEAAAGGYVDPTDITTVTAAGATLAIDVLNEYGAPLTNFEDTFMRLLRYNAMDGMDAPFIIHGDNSFYTFNRRRGFESGVNIFTANDEGVDLGLMANTFNYIPFLDTTGQLFGSKTDAESLIVAPGAARLMFNSDFVGDAVINFPHYKKFTITGPYGIPFEYEWKYHECGTLAGKVVIVLRCLYRLITKATTDNHCELAGTNDIIKVDFGRCAAVGCPEDVV